LYMTRGYAKFNLEGYAFIAPGAPFDLSAPPRLFINCRCTTLPAVTAG